MEIVRITKDISSKVSELYALSWKAGYRNIVSQKYLDELSPERWTSSLQDSPYDGYVLQDCGKFVATSSIAPAREEDWYGWGEIISLYVLPEHFHQGYGRKLLAFVTDRLREKGYRRIYLWVLEENRQARTFYEHNGFSPNGDKCSITIEGKHLVELRYIKTTE